MKDIATKPAIAFGDNIQLPYASLAEALMAGIKKAENGYFLSIKTDGRQVKMPWAQSLARAWMIIENLKFEGIAAGAALVLRLQEADEIVTCIHAGILGGYVILPMTARIDQPLSPAVSAEFPQIVDIDAAAFQRLTRGGNGRTFHSHTRHIQGYTLRHSHFGYYRFITIG
ncbi:hypothetical protein [Brucella pseudogrignonensis]|uniref:AMP-dependent synthetase/ligase domain-containing protein n=1 Tax=Brucella pseudogrignonensis TaxID=419475 RepID=A0ABU1M8X5_9HYPH|nr:hypothetical protein [Brucella pseudogrignonensis]MDR6432290.1 hypothetical protein [Brucella pseudogrignonensis]